MLVTCLSWRIGTWLGKNARLLGKPPRGTRGPERRKPCVSEAGAELTALYVPSPPSSTRQPMLEPESPKQGIRRQDQVKPPRPQLIFHFPSPQAPCLPAPCPTGDPGACLKPSQPHCPNLPSPGPTAAPSPSPCWEENPTSSISLGRPPSLSTWALSCSASTLNYSLSLASCPQACPSSTGQLAFPKLLSAYLAWALLQRAPRAPAA